MYEHCFEDGVSICLTDKTGLSDTHTKEYNILMTIKAIACVGLNTEEHTEQYITLRVFYQSHQFNIIAESM